jgi:hypothetical protein
MLIISSGWLLVLLPAYEYALVIGVAAAKFQPGLFCQQGAAYGAFSYGRHFTPNSGQHDVPSPACSAITSGLRWMIFLDFATDFSAQP